MMHGLDLFSGIGGISLALRPWVRTVAYCEIDRYCEQVLRARGLLDDAQLFGDIRHLDANQIPGVDIIYGGFPCQPFSHAARGRNNAVDLWPEMFRLIQECSPRFVFAENVTRRAIEAAANGLTEIGYVVKCLELSAAAVGAPFERKRFWLLADSDGDSELRLTVNAEVAGPQEAFEAGRWQEHRPELLGVDDGLPGRMDRLRALGNAVVPLQARKAFQILSGMEAA